MVKRGSLPLPYDVVIALVNYPVMSALLPMEIKNVRFAVVLEGSPAISRYTGIDFEDLTSSTEKLIDLIGHYAGEGKRVALAGGILPKVVRKVIEKKFGDEVDFVVGSGNILLEFFEGVLRNSVVSQVEEFPFGENF